MGWVEWGSSGGKFLAAGTVQLSPLGSLSRAQLRALFWRLFKKTLMKLCKPDLRNHKGAARRTSFHPLDLNQAEKQQQNILALTAIPLGTPCARLQRCLVPASSCRSQNPPKYPRGFVHEQPRAGFCGSEELRAPSPPAAEAPCTEGTGEERAGSRGHDVATPGQTSAPAQPQHLQLGFASSPRAARLREDLGQHFPDINPPALWGHPKEPNINLPA